MIVHDSQDKGSILHELLWLLIAQTELQFMLKGIPNIVYDNVSLITLANIFVKVIYGCISKFAIKADAIIVLVYKMDNENLF